MSTSDEERLRRWRLVLGGDEAEGTGASLSGEDQRRDRALAALYDAEKRPEGGRGRRRGGLGASAPTVARWLGDVRELFPTSVVRVMQQDAMDRLGLRQLLFEPELLSTVEVNVHLVADLLALSGMMPAKAKALARDVVRRCVEDLERRLAEPLREAVTGALHRAARQQRPRHGDIDWNRTIRANLKNYLPEHHTVVPEHLVGFGKKRRGLKEIILCIDQSGSMATSVIYSGVFGSVLASLPAVSTKVVVFDTAVVDLTDKLGDPVEVLFGTQLGGGTDIHQALTYCQSLVTQPDETILVLVSDLIEGGVRENLLKRAASLIASGVQLVTLLALSDDGAPVYDHDNAAALATLGSPAFACTPEQFPELMAAAIQRQDVGAWAAARGLLAARGNG
ncbi:VWA domain-containing protein [Myxococcota bacterium]|nr:VWA domain-containing protein [Myxococcota bacterium]